MVAARLRKMLGLSAREADLLAKRARLHLGGRPYAVRLAAFLLATAPLMRRLLPKRLRVAAIRPFVYGLVPGPAENLLYARATELRDDGR